MSSKALGGASMLANKNITFFGYNFSKKKNYCSGHNFVEKLKLEYFWVTLSCFNDRNVIHHLVKNLKFFVKFCNI